MRTGGINLLAVLVAAIAIYAVGFITYGLLIPQEWWLAASGISQSQIEAQGMARMAFGAVMPVMTALFLAILFRMGGVTKSATGFKWALVVGLASAVPALLYGWVYGVGPFDLTLVDSAHLLTGHAVAGAILGGWR